MLTNIASGFTTPQPFPGSQLVKSKIAASVEKDGRRLGSGKVSTRPSPAVFLFVCLFLFSNPHVPSSRPYELRAWNRLITPGKCDFLLKYCRSDHVTKRWEGWTAYK